MIKAGILCFIVVVFVSHLTLCSCFSSSAFLNYDLSRRLQTSSLLQQQNHNNILPATTTMTEVLQHHPFAKQSQSIAFSHFISLSSSQQQQQQHRAPMMKLAATLVNGENMESRKLIDEDESESEIKELEFTMKKHKPLGCTVEESLAVEEGKSSSYKHVFVAKVTEGGYAEKAGLSEGDVVVGVTGVFDDIVDVDGVGLEKIRSLIVGKNPSEPLTIRVLRGTDVKERHEVALLELCMLPGGTDDTLEKCINDLYSAEYDSFGNMVSEDEDDEEGEICVEMNDDGECLVDSMYQLWGEELPETSMLQQANKEEDKVVEEKPKVAPWSSRSSPSGTYVRNPKTGKLENIG